MPKLEIITGEYAQHQFLVEKVGVWIGSDERCDLRLEEPGISRFHVQILRDSQGIYWLEDAGSSFGTLLNGQDVERSPLQNGDVITLGRVKLCYHDIPATAAQSISSASSSYTPSRPQSIPAEQDWLSPTTAAQDLVNTPPPPAIQTDFALSAEQIQSTQHALMAPPNEDEDVEVLDGDELELIEEQDPEESATDWDNDDDYPVETEGTRLTPIPLSPHAFFSNTATPQAPAVKASISLSASPSPMVVARRPMTSSPSVIPDPTVFPSVIQTTSSPGQTTKKSYPETPQNIPDDETHDEVDDDDMDLHGPPPPPRSRTVLFNLELERLKFELQQREKQLISLQVEAEQRSPHEDQQAWMKQTLDMVQEDNKRLQYQISAYEEAAEENEQLIKQVEKLLEDNKRLYNDNKKLREKLKEYEQYFHQQGYHSGSQS